MAHLAAVLVTPYEFHRDEFLYFAMGTHLRLFQMDFPPLIALLSEAVRGLAGTGLFGYRLVPALAGTALMVLAVAAAREMGGGPRAQLLTALAVLVSPLFLRTAALFQPVVLDQLWWMLGFLALIRLERTGEPRWWLLLGVAGGLGLLSKFSILFFGASVLIAMLLTSRRRDLATKLKPAVTTNRIMDRLSPTKNWLPMALRSRVMAYALLLVGKETESLFPDPKDYFLRRFMISSQLGITSFPVKVMRSVATT